MSAEVTDVTRGVLAFAESARSIEAVIGRIAPTFVVAAVAGVVGAAILTACSGSHEGGRSDAATVSNGHDSGRDGTVADSGRDGFGGADGAKGTDGNKDSARDTGFDAGITVCTPTDAGPVGSPVIFYAPSPVAPGQAALLFGNDIGAAATVRGVRLDDSAPGLPPGAADCIPTDAGSLEVLQASDVSVKAEVPASWTAGLYALVVQNATGASVPAVLNRPRIDWIHGGPGGPIVAGSTFDVYGRSFGPNPSGWLVDATGKATSLASVESDASDASDAADAGAPGAAHDGYVGTFAAPSLAAGSYGLYVHSGLGGPFGFSEAFPVTVAAAPAPWPTTVYEVAPSANDDDTLAAAITLAQGDGGAGSGGVIEFATGTYTLTHGVTLPPRTVLRSKTGHKSDVTLAWNEPAIPFPYGFASAGTFIIESITMTSSTSARLVQCPTGGNFLRDPQEGEPQYQPDAPCQSATLRDVSFTMTTLRNEVVDGAETTTPVSTIMVDLDGVDTVVSDSSLTNTGGSALQLSNATRAYILRNTLLSGTTRFSADAAVPLLGAAATLGGNIEIYSMTESAFVGNTAGAAPGLGGGGSAGIEYVAHNLYIAGNTFGPNITDYGEGFSFDAPYYPNYLGTTTSSEGRTVTIPRVLNSAGHSVFSGPATGTWAASTVPALNGSTGLAGSSAVVVNGTGLGEYAEVVSNAATAADGTTELTLDRDFPIALDATSVLEIATLKSKVVFARNAFRDVAVGAQLYAGGYDFIIDGNTGNSLEGTYCNSNDFMDEQGGTASGLTRRFSRCYFNQWLGNTLNDAVDSTFAWERPGHGDGVFTPYKNGLIGIGFGVGNAPFLPAVRGLGVVGNILRGNQVENFTVGLISGPGNAPLTGPIPELGQDNILEQNSTKSVPVAVVVDSHFPGTLIRNNTCTGDCETTVLDENDGGP